ncbi:hypothetical protein [Bradyrhizobium sp. CCBAU 53380]|uniref:hypothetical protein n=1 Tax=Bradyrhizobium sp. CCBAU 53380 TaxID=1325117 RepID=UPI002302B090|nr:hypothetical protein [Bradyrhizobium sp. CCBAU 53380]MDA9427129.1 hypothetical protein [Bradyrhizobium sp. CCBAU 53380]
MHTAISALILRMHMQLRELVDYLISTGEQFGRKREAESFGGLHVYKQLKLGRLLEWQFGRICARREGTSRSAPRMQHGVPGQASVFREDQRGQQERGERCVAGLFVGAGQVRSLQPAHTSILPATAAMFGKTVTVGEPRPIHRLTRRAYKTGVCRDIGCTPRGSRPWYRAVEPPAQRHSQSKR